MKYRYRYYGASSQVMERATRHLHKLGKILSARGYRYLGRYHTTHEALMLVGENGTARFSGICWGYSGQGPRTLVEVLMRLGLSKDWAEVIAFKSYRYDAIGTDWELIFGENKIIYQARAA